MSFILVFDHNVHLYHEITRQSHYLAVNYQAWEYMKKVFRVMKIQNMEFPCKFLLNGDGDFLTHCLVINIHGKLKRDVLQNVPPSRCKSFPNHKYSNYSIDYFHSFYVLKEIRK